MTAALDTQVQEKSNKTSRSRAAWLMTVGFLVYTLLILIGHIVGFPLGYAYLHTVCPSGCSLTPENVRALEHIGLSISFYANLYMVIQVLYILVSVGIALLIVFKKPGQLVPLGLSFFLIWFSAYEGADYPALVTAYPALNVPVQLLLFLGGGILGFYAFLTFPNGKFGSRWVLGFYLVSVFEGVLAVFITTPVFVLINSVFSFLSFFIILGVLIYRSRRLLNARERAATKWIILSLSIFIPTVILVFFVLPAVAPADSLALLIVNIAGFFGCGINIAGILMAVLYANAFDIDVFVRRTLVYTLLTAILALLYAGMVFGSQFGLATFSPQAAQSPFILVGSTLVIAALFQPMRHRIQRTIDRRFYRQKYDASRVIERFSASLHSEIDLADLSEQVVAVVQETMQPAHVSLWLRKPSRTKNL
jgi:MFS family permease